jgi:predicted AlkP superfamily pyrophosphatase or phosphodiesterase
MPGSRATRQLCPVITVALFGLFLPASAALQSVAQPVEHVILVSVDGLLPASYLNPDAHGLKVPLLREIVRRGAYSEALTSVFPTLTYPAHTSLATGAEPAEHGITTNAAPDPMQQNQQGWRWYAEDIRVPALWDVARTRGLRTALVWWPVTVGARADALVPELWRARTTEDIKLVRALSTPGLLEAAARRFPKLLDGLIPPEVDDESVTDIAVHVLETERPNLMLVHLLEVDRFQHRDGPLKGRALAAVEKTDRMLARLAEAARQAGIWEKTALVVVSDHGFAAYRRTVRVGALLRQNGWITLDEGDEVKDWKAYVVAGGGHAYVYLRDPGDEAARRRLWGQLAPLAGKPESGIGRLYSREEIRQLGGDPEAVLALEAAPGFAMSNGYPEAVLALSDDVATHGFDPLRDDMQASLLIYGPSIAPQRLPRARLVDIAPTIAEWLELELKSAAGRPLALKLAPSAAAGQ